MAFWSFKAHWFLDAPASSDFKNCTSCPHCIYGLCIYRNTNSHFALYNLKWLDFITEMKSVYCAVRPGLYKTVYISSLKSYIIVSVDWSYREGGHEEGYSNRVAIKAVDNSCGGTYWAIIFQFITTHRKGGRKYGGQKWLHSRKIKKVGRIM
jgi:hypothetical protein